MFYKYEKLSGEVDIYLQQDVCHYVSYTYMYFLKGIRFKTDFTVSNTSPCSGISVSAVISSWVKQSSIAGTCDG